MAIIDTLMAIIVISEQCESQKPDKEDIIKKDGIIENISELKRKIEIYEKNGEYSKQIKNLDDLIGLFQKEKVSSIDYIRALKTMEAIILLYY